MTQATESLPFAIYRHEMCPNLSYNELTMIIASHTNPPRTELLFDNMRESLEVI